MARLNLLPWRERHRAERQRAFLLALCAFAALGVALVILADLFYSARIESREQRGAYLREHIAALQQELAEIQDMQRQRGRLLDHMDVIQVLQAGRSTPVRVLDQLAQTVPEGVYYSGLKAEGEALVVTGVAESHDGVSSLMRRLEASGWFAAPSLEEVRAEPDLGPRAMAFNLALHLPGGDTPPEAGGPQHGGAR